ncbi:MAG: type II and III secretion system protein family protein [Alphaproteobacteria bacterium]
MKSARPLLAALMAALLVAGGPANPAIAQSEVVNVTAEPIRIETSKGVLVRLPAPATTVFIADADVADVQVKSPRLVYLYGKKPGDTSLFAVDAQDRVLISRAVNVSHNLSRLQSAIQSLVPENTVELKTVDNALVLSGEVSSAAAAADLQKLTSQMLRDDKAVLNRLSIRAPNQVHLRVRVAEVARDTLKTFGFNWDALFSSGSFLFGLATGSLTNVAGSFITRSNQNNNLFGRYNRGNFDINGVIDALDDEGMISILAEPNLTALSGETATFLAGGEFPILVPDDGRVTIEFKQFGVSLAFTPTLVNEERISLRVKPEVSELSSTGAVQISGFTVPALTTRRAETTVELGSGQSFAIAGLLRNNVTKDLTAFPGLGELPILGALFRSDRFRREETELVIIVTPYIVRPVSTKALAAPNDGLTAPTDFGRIVHGQVQQPKMPPGPSAPRGPDGRGLIGPVGFSLD